MTVRAGVGCAALSALILASFPVMAEEEGEAASSASADVGLSAAGATGDGHAKAPLAMGIDLVYGFGEVGHGGATTEVSVYSALFGAFYYTGHSRFGLRFPYTSTTFEGHGESVSHAAIGNLEASFEHALVLGEDTELALELGVALPTAAGDPLGDDREVKLAGVQHAASFARGLEEEALFVPRYMGFVPRVGILHEPGSLRLAAFQKVETLVRTGAIKVSNGVESESVAAFSVTTLEGGYVFLPQQGWAGARIWLAYAIQEPYPSHESHAQTVLEPRIGGQLGPVEATLGYLIPLGGRLSDPGIQGIRIAALGRF